MVADGEGRDGLADAGHDAGALVAQHDRGREGDGATHDGEIAVADARGLDRDLDLAGSRVRALEVVDQGELLSIEYDPAHGHLPGIPFVFCTDTIPASRMEMGIRKSRILIGGGFALYANSEL